MAAEDVVATGADPSELEGGGLLHEIFTSPLNLLLLGLCIFLLYKIVRGDQPGASGDNDDDEPPPLPRLKRRDFTPAELRRFDGVQDPRILMAINGKVFDVTKGRKFYGPGTEAGPGGRGDKRGDPGVEAGRERGRGRWGAPVGGSEGRRAAMGAGRGHEALGGWGCVRGDGMPE
jgi:membrane-associated progesterone receptor component